MSTRSTADDRDVAVTSLIEPLSAADVGASWKKLAILGALTMVLGLVAIGLPHMATLAVEIMVGALLLVNGLFEVVHAAQLKGRRGRGWRITAAVVAIVVGGALLLFPLPGIISLTLVLAAFFLVEGVLKARLAFELRPLQGWGWLLFSGLLALLLGAFILFTWPVAAPWLLGLLLGVDLVFGGWWLLLLGLAGRRWAREGA